MNTVIQDQQKIAKVKDDLNRRTQAVMAIDFYNYRQKEYIELAMQVLYPQTYTELIKYIHCIDITRSLIDDTAILFQKPLKVILDTTDAMRALAAEIFAASELWKKCLAADRMSDLTGKVGMGVHWHEADKRVVIDIITPDRCFIEQDPEDPTKAIKVYYRVGDASNTANSGRVDIYACWTNEKYYEVEILNDYSEGKKVVGSEIANPYGRIPIVWLSKYIETDSFWVDHGYPIVDENLNLDLRESNLDLAIDFQTFSTLVTSGLNSSDPLNIGIQRRIDLPVNAVSGEAQGSADYITPSPMLTEVVDIITKRKVDLARQNGLSAESFNRDSSNFNSGYQLRLSKQDVLNDNELKKEQNRPSYIQLIQNILDCYSFNSDSSRFSNQETITLEFAPIVFDTNPVEQQNLYTLEMNNGIRSRIEILMAERNITREEAITLAEQIDADNNKAVVSPATPAWLNP